MLHYHYSRLPSLSLAKEEMWKLFLANTWKSHRFARTLIESDEAIGFCLNKTGVWVVRTWSFSQGNSNLKQTPWILEMLPKPPTKSEPFIISNEIGSSKKQLVMVLLKPSATHGQSEDVFLVSKLSNRVLLFLGSAYSSSFSLMNTISCGSANFDTLKSPSCNP